MAQKGKKESKIVWQDEIKRLEIVAIDQLLANPKNWKTHSKTAREALEGSLDELGIIKPLIINLRTDAAWPPEDRGIDVMLDGHRRVLVSMERGQPTWPAIFVDLPPAKEAKALLILDELTRLHGADKGLLDSLLREVHTPNQALMQMLDVLAQEHGIVSPASSTPIETPEPQLDRSEELRRKWDVELGQLWACGEHRVLCGDSTDEADIERVMEGKSIQDVLTDPPYGISWDTDYTRFTNDFHVKQRHYSPINADEKPFNPSRWLNIPRVVLWGANWYCQHIPIGTWLVWDKRHATGSALLSDAEIGWMRGGQGVYLYAETVQGAIRQEQAMHPTQKPAGLMRWCIEKAHMDQVILDPYLGSGTTLFACEQLKRHCHGIEIDPGYVAVTLQRYCDLTGDRPTLLP